MITYNIHYNNDNLKNSTKSVLLRFMLHNNYVPTFNLIRKHFLKNSDMFLYLIQKYMKDFKKLSLHKASSKKIYQTVCKQYIHKTVRVSMEVHQLLKDISMMTGYSVSLIIRLLIEWEMEHHDPSNQMRDYNPRGESTPHLFLSNPITVVTNITRVVIFHIYDIMKGTVLEAFHIEFT